MSDRSDKPDITDWGSSSGTSAIPRLVPSPRETSSPRTVKIDVTPKSFSGEGDADTIRDLYRRAGLYRLIENLGLALLALLMLVVAALVILYAPAERAALVPWIALPACALGLGLGGFAVFRIRVTEKKFEVSGEAPSLKRERRP